MSKNWGENLSYEERGSLAQLVKSLRQTAGLSKKVLADEAKISRQTLDNIESGARVPQADVLQRVLEAVGYETDAPMFEAKTETWLVMIGTLIETVPAPSRDAAVERVMLSLARDVRASGASSDDTATESNVADAEQDDPHTVDLAGEYDLAASEDDSVIDPHRGA